MSILELEKAVTAWPEMAGTLFVPHTEDKYHRLVAILDGLIDEVREDETHPLSSLMEIIGILVERYEAEHVPEMLDEQSP